MRLSGDVDYDVVNWGFYGRKYTSLQIKATLRSPWTLNDHSNVWTVSTAGIVYGGNVDSDSGGRKVHSPNVNHDNHAYYVYTDGNVSHNYDISMDWDSCGILFTFPS